jgi:DNA-binding IclR family transcriptional regulator
MAHERTTGRSVTSKVLAILATYETGATAKTLTEMADSAAVPLPTAHRLVGELVRWGALDRDAGGRYHLGLRLWEVSQNAGRQLRDTARPYLQDLFSLTQETAHIAVREGHEALYIDRVYSSKRVPRASRVGGRLPLHATAVGKVLLAYEEPWVREAYLQRTLEAPTKRTHADPALLAVELAGIRDRGYATTLEEVRAASCSIAVPIAHPQRRAVAAIGLVMLSTQAAQMTHHLRALHGVARRIEAAVARYPAEYLTGRHTGGRRAVV